MISGYPRPQLHRPGATLLDGEWEFAIDHTESGSAQRWFLSSDPFTTTIQVPFPPESPASGIGTDPDSPIWYRREIQLKLSPGTRQLLHFEGIDHRAAVWVNGVHVTDHEGSQARFSCDITDVAHDGTNVLVVRAIDDRRNLEQPRGKQDWLPEPHVIWYRRTSGIWRTVWSEVVPDAWIEHLRLEPQPDLRSVAFTVTLAGRALAEPRVSIRLQLEDLILGEVEVRGNAGGASGLIILDHDCLDTEPELLQWTPETPTLLDATITLKDSQHVVDRVKSYVGLRSVAVDGNQILLNGRPYFLRLVLEQAYWPESHLSAPSTHALEAEARLIKELGFNGLRMHQVSADPRFLECCDRLGLLVLADAAAAYRFSATALRRTTEELIAVVTRDINHPSLIGWIPFNESWGLTSLQSSRPQQHAVEAVYHLLKALDPSRIALGNDGWHHIVGDLIGIHDYSQIAATLRRRYGTAASIADTLNFEQPAGRPLTLRVEPQPKPVVLTEFGGISAHDDPAAWAAYGKALGFDDLGAAVSELVSAVGPRSGLAGFCYTQLTDTAQEKNGLLTADRTPKCPPAHIRAAVLQDASSETGASHQHDGHAEHYPPIATHRDGYSTLGHPADRTGAEISAR